MNTSEGDNSKAELEMKKLELIKELDNTGDLFTNAVQSTCNENDLSITNKTSHANLESSTTNDTGAGDSGIEPGEEKVTLKDVLADLSQQRIKATEKSEVEKRRNRLKNLFPLSVSQDNKKKTDIQQDCVDIVKYLESKKVKMDNEKENNSTPSELTDPGFFGDRLSAFKMLFCEERNHLKNNDIDGFYVLKLFRGDIVGAVNYAIENKAMSRSLVAYAPMAGFDVWQMACLAYAEQLAKDGSTILASQYFICCNQVKKAITLLSDNKHYREAVVLARTHLLDDDPFLIDIVTLWASKLKYGGSYDMAAKCYASIGEFEKAANCLSYYATLKPIPGPNEIKAFLAAMSVCKNASLHDLYIEYGRQALASILLNNVWKDAHDASTDFFEDYASAFRLIICVHEVLLRFDSANGKHLKSIQIDFAKENFTLDSTKEEPFSVILSIWDTVIGVNGSTPLDKLLDVRRDIVAWATDPNLSTSNLAIKNTVLQMSIQLAAVLLNFIVTKHEGIVEDIGNEHVLSEKYCATIKTLSQGISLSNDEKAYFSFLVHHLTPYAHCSS